MFGCVSLPYACACVCDEQECSVCQSCPQPCSVLSQLQASLSRGTSQTGHLTGAGVGNAVIPRESGGITAVLHTSASSPHAAFPGQQVLAAGTLNTAAPLSVASPHPKQCRDQRDAPSINSVKMSVWLCERTACWRRLVLHGGPIGHGE